MSTIYGPLTIYSPNGQYSSQGSFPNWQPSQFSKDDADTNAFGSGVHSYIGFNTLKVTVTSGVVTGFSMYVYSGGEGVDTSYSQSFSGGSYTVTVNGSTFFTSSATPLGTTLVSYQAPSSGPNPVEIQIQGQITVSGRDGGLIERSATSSFDISYKFYVQSANLVFSSYDSTLPAPYSAKMVFLQPPVSTDHGKMIAIKDKSFQAESMQTWIYSPPGYPIENNAVPGAEQSYLYQNGQCNTYMIDYTNATFRVLNVYPSSLQDTLSTGSITGLTAVPMTSDTVNIFSVDSGITPNRTTSNNLVQLPTVSNPSGEGSLLILVYAGKTSTKYTGNVLFIEEPSGGNLIDNTYSTLKPYIQTDTSGAEKNTGIVFISNEDQWFILGYYPTTDWSVFPTSPPSPTRTMSNDLLVLDLLPTTANASEVVQGPTPGTDSLSIVKVQGVAGSSPYVTFSVPGTGNRYNVDTEYTYYTGNAANSATWIVAVYDGSQYYKYYIVVAYTPS